MQNNHLVVGGGEVGQAIANVLDCEIVDLDKAKCRGELGEVYEFLHICIPFSENFENIVVVYKAKFSPRHTVIHSTVPIGTSRKLGAVHSPVRGKHPNLTKSITTFVKYFGGDGASAVAREFKNVESVCYPKQETTEALKLCDLLQYATSIILAKEISEFCAKMDLKYEEVYTFPNITYNQGYTDMDQSQFVRPILDDIPGKIGGHCIIQNIPKLDIPIVRYIINKNNQL